MRKLAFTMLLAAVFVAAFASYAGAFTMSEKVVVANELIAIARVPAGGFTADQRINRVNERLAYILGYEPLAPRDIRAVYAPGGSRAIMVGDTLLVTVTRNDARANNTTVSALARVWVSRAEAAIPQARPYANLVG